MSFTLFQKIPFSRRIPPRHLILFTRQLATLLDAGLPLLRGLHTLILQEKNQHLRHILSEISGGIESGNTLSESLAHHPKFFSPFYVQMIQAGERGGVLEIVLLRLAEFQEKAEKIKTKIIAALIYPVVVFLMALTILTFLLIFIVPQFEQIFQDMLQGHPLPDLTLFILGISRWVQESWPLLFAISFIGFLITKWIVRSPQGASLFDQWILKSPLLGELFHKTALAQLTRTLATLLRSGVPLLEALHATQKTVRNLIFQKAIAHIHLRVKEGDPLASPLEASGVATPLVLSMVQVGEETGRLPEMLIKVADVYDEEIDQLITTLTRSIEPLLIIFLAFFVGTIVIALFLPLLTIIEQLGHQF